MRLTLDIYTYRFSFYFQNYSVLWNTIVTFMKVVLNSIFTPSSEGPPRKLWENYIKIVYSERILRF